MRVEKLRTLLDRIQTNRARPRDGRSTSAKPAEAPAPTRARTSPLEQAIRASSPGELAGVPVREAAPAREAPPVRAAPVVEPVREPIPSRAAHTEPMAPAVRPAAAIEPRAIPAPSPLPPSAPIAAASAPSVVVETDTFGDLVSRSVALRPR